MSVDSSMLHISEGIRFENEITKYSYHAYQPLASTRYTYNDEIRFQIHHQDIYTLPSESFILIEGVLKKSEKEATKEVIFVQNGISFLFEFISFELNGIEVDKTRQLGYASLIKGLVSLTNGEHSMLTNAGWNTDFNKHVLTANGDFTVCVPLKLWLGIMEDYKKIFVGVRQDLILLRAKNDANALHSTAAAVDANSTVEIRNMTWYVPHVTVSDSARVSLLRLVEKDVPLTVPYRSWEFQENPALTKSKRNTWTIMSTSQFEKPRYVILAFQTNRKSDMTKYNDRFDSITLKDVKLYLNSESYPYCNLNLDTDKNNVALLYTMYINFQRSYYHRDTYDVILNRSDFFNNQPLVVFDVNCQNDSIRTGPVDLRVEVETKDDVAATTSAFCLIVHDRIVTYTALSNLVKKL